MNFALRALEECLRRIECGTIGLQTGVGYSLFIERKMLNMNKEFEE